VSLTAIAFLLSYAAGCVLAFARHPIYGLITYVGVMYLHPPSRWWGVGLPSLRWSLLAAVITLLALFVASTRDPQRPFFKQGFVIGFIGFLGWLVAQQFWALNPTMHWELTTLSFKYLLLMALMYKCIDSEANLRLFLWANALGCLYFGSIALTQYTGGRFEGFGGPGIGEANAAGIQVVTGIFSIGALFLASGLAARAALFAIAPFVVNALVVTVSRSAFVALGVAGVVFNLFTPRKYRKFVVLCSVLGLVLFVMLTNPLYWSRISTIMAGGEEIEGVDTGSGRLVLIEAQFEMAAAHPLGCGHRCTAVLSPYYLEDHHLTGRGEERFRSSHNTFMSLLVEQGIPGAIFYVLLTIWTLVTLRKLRRLTRRQSGLIATSTAATASVLVAIMIGDLFVDYLKNEARIWFIALAMVLVNLAERERAEEDSRLAVEAPPAGSGSPEIGRLGSPARN
jgi:O-antigen ligase